MQQSDTVLHLVGERHEATLDGRHRAELDILLPEDTKVSGACDACVVGCGACIVGSACVLCVRVLCVTFSCLRTRMSLMRVVPVYIWGVCCVLCVLCIFQGVFANAQKSKRMHT